MNLDHMFTPVEISVKVRDRKMERSAECGSGHELGAGIGHLLADCLEPSRLQVVKCVRVRSLCHALKESLNPNDEADAELLVAVRRWLRADKEEADREHAEAMRRLDAMRVERIANKPRLLRWMDKFIGLED